MTDSALHFALREWRAHMGLPVRLAGLFGAAAVLTLMGPFGSAELMRALPRLVYWTGLVFATYSAGFFANMVAERYATTLARRIAIAVPLTALANCVLVLGINAAAFGFWPGTPEFVSIALVVIGISAIIALIIQMAYDHLARQMQAAAPTDTAPTDTPQSPAILDRIPLEKRAPLVALSVEDHYVRVRTTTADHMVLMRLGDAIREVGATSGFQVHRSHWAATAQITRVERAGAGALLHMTTGAPVPVSRRYLSQIKEAGLLP